MTKPKNSNYGYTPNIKSWHIKIPYWYYTQNLKLCKSSKLKMWQKPKNWNCDKTKKRIKIVIKLNNSIYNKMQKFKLWQYKKENLWQNSNSNSYKLKTQIGTNLKPQIMTKGNFRQNSKKVFCKTTWHFDNRWYLLGAAFCNLAMLFVCFVFYWGEEPFLL